jgi:hypothetical protein
MTTLLELVTRVRSDEAEGRIDRTAAISEILDFGGLTTYGAADLLDNGIRTKDETHDLPCAWSPR